MLRLKRTILAKRGCPSHNDDGYVCILSKTSLFKRWSESQPLGLLSISSNYERAETSSDRSSLLE